MARKLRQRVSMWFDPIKPRLRRANVCVFHPGRVGSTVLNDQLRQHPRIHWAGEIYWRVFREHREHPEPKRYLAAVDRQKMLREAMLKAGMSIFGCEIQFLHLVMFDLSVRQMVDELERRHFHHFVVMNRRNLLRRLASAIRLRKTGNISRQPIGQTPTLAPVRIDPAAAPHLAGTMPLLELFAWHERQLADTERALEGRNVLRLTYEDDVEHDPSVAYRRMCGFLGVEPIDVALRLGRMNPFPLREMVENYGEVAEALHGTRHAWMLDA